MISIRFAKNKRFKQKKMSILEGVELLAKIEADVSHESPEEKETVEIRVFEDKKEILQDDFILGEGNGYELFSYFEDQLLTLYPDNQEEIDRLIGKLSEGLRDDRRRQKTSTASAVSPRSKPQRQKRKMPFVLIGGGLVILLALAVGSFFVLRGSVNHTSAFSTEETKVLTLEERLAAEDPLAVVTSDPKVLKKVIEILTEQEQFEKIQEINEEFPTPEAKFVLDFRDQKWEEVVNNAIPELSNDQQIMLAIAYIRLGKISEAEIINEKIQSSRLTTEITNAKRKNVILLLREKKVKEAQKVVDQLKEPEMQEYVDTAELLIKMIKLYQEEKDKENEKIWQRKLDNLGEEILNVQERTT